MKPLDCLVFRDARDRRHLTFYRRARGLGDAVHLTAVVQGISEGLRKEEGERPDIEIVMRRSLLPVWDNNPYVDSVEAVESWRGQRNAEGFLDVSMVCGQYETFHQPNVDKNRRDIWLEHCALPHTKVVPTLYLTPMELEYGQRYRQKLGEPRWLIAVGYKTAEKWKDYPHIPLVIEALAKRADTRVVVFHSSPVKEKFGKNVSVAAGLSLREYFGMMSACDLLVSPDTGHVHVAGALGVPIYGLFGPTGRIILSAYDVPIRFAREFTACGRQACWYRPCRGKWCLTTLPPNEVVGDVENFLKDLGRATIWVST